MNFNIVTYVLVFVVGAAAGSLMNDFFSPDGVTGKLTENGLSAAAGGIVTYALKYFFDRQKTRTENVNRRIDVIEGLIRTYEAKGVTYWVHELVDAEARSLESEIKSLRKRIAAEISALKKHGYKCGTKCLRELIELYQAVTDGDFEGGGRGRVEIHRVDRINDAANAAILELRASLGVI